MQVTRLVLAVVVVLVVASPAGAAVKRWYWTPAQANTAVIQQATRPYCAALADVSKCAAGKPLPGVVVNPVVTRASDCVGIPAFRSGGRFSQFICKIFSNNETAPGTLRVYTVGPTKIRWKRV